MSERLILNVKNKELKLRPVTTGMIAAGMLLALTVCDQKQTISDGMLYKKEHVEEAASLIPVPIGKGVDVIPVHQPDRWRIYLAKCPQTSQLADQKIAANCKTAFFDVPRQVFNNLKIGQYVDCKANCIKK